jgi:hypothetical protein
MSLSLVCFNFWLTRSGGGRALWMAANSSIWEGELHS